MGCCGGSGRIKYFFDACEEGKWWAVALLLLTIAVLVSFSAVIIKMAAKV